jgi:hypothetical protein
MSDRRWCSGPERGRASCRFVVEDQPRRSQQLRASGQGKIWVSVEKAIRSVVVNESAEH